MEAKETVRALLDLLPDDCSVDDILYHLYVLHALEHGQGDTFSGRAIPREEVVDALRRRWRQDGG